jgi:hypothetical protein
MKLFRTSSTVIFLLSTCLGFCQTVTKYTDLHDFGGRVTNANGKSGPDGYFARAGVTFDSAGNMYGTTSVGGQNNDGYAGMVWEITKSGKYLDLHDFWGTVVNANGKNGLDGASPTAGVTFDSSGNMYGTASGGGPNGGGMVWEITISGKYLDLHDFGGTVVSANGKSGSDGYNPNAGVTFDRGGNMYGTTTGGGASDGAGLVWEITKSGKYVDLHDFGGTVVNANGKSGPDGGSPHAKVTFDGAGNMYGTATGGGPHSGNGIGGMVWEISKSGKYLDLHDFGGTVVNANGKSGPDGNYPEAEVTFDGAGNMYGTTSFGGPVDTDETEGGGVWEFTKSGKYLDLHDFGGTLVNANGKMGPDGASPWAGVSFDSAGNLYGTTSDGGPNGGGVVWEITKSEKYLDIRDFGGTALNANGKSGPDGDSPYAGVTFDSSGSMYGTTSLGGPNDEDDDGGGGLVWKLSIITVSIQSFTLTPNAVIGGATSTGRIVLSDAAPAGGFVVTLASSSSFATPPVSVTVPAGAGSAHFSVTTSAVATAFSASITAKLGASSKTASLAVHPAYVVGLSVSPSSVVGGASSTGTVTLNGPAPAGGWKVRLSSSSSSVKTSDFVTVAAGSKTATFPISTSAVASNVSVTITAKLNFFSKTAQLSVTH